MCVCGVCGVFDLVFVFVMDNKICMVHDLAESLVGDITPYDGVSKEDKRKLEEVLYEF